MRYTVILTEGAARDLEDLYGYLEKHESPERADHVLGRIEKTFERLSDFPERGTHPNELLALGIREYRQVFLKPYRILYKVLGKKVYVMLIADGRRDMQTLLERRLLEA